MKNRIAKIVLVGGLILTPLALTACSQPSTLSGTAIEQKQSAQDLKNLVQSQPVPAFKWSQIRQTLIDIETAQAHTTQTTSFFFNQGVQDPVQTCPSIGFPVATTSEITNPQQVVQRWDGGSNQFPVISQIDPNGIYAGNSTGTYVICVSPDGTTYADYFEGFVQAVSGPAVWDTATHSVKMTGPSTATFNTTKTTGP